MSGGPLLLGMGPWPGGPARQVGFAQLRLRHFHEVLAGTGLPVRVVVLGEDEGPEARRGEDHGPPRMSLDPEHPATLSRLEELARTASCVVSAGPYLPGRLAALAAGDTPLWADIPGDPFAELHAQSLHGEVDAQRLAEAMAHALPVLDRADAISVISQRQRLATLGELGARGRLLGPELPGAVQVIPIAWAFPSSPRAPRERDPEEPLRVLCMGALNAWFDEQTLIDGLALALDHDERVELHLCGGAHPAHPEAAWQRVARFAASRPDRVHLHGWLDQGELDDLLDRCHLGLSLDRPGVEPMLGSRTRVLGFLHAGLPVLASRGTELVDTLARQRAVVGLPPGDPTALADRMLAMADAPGNPEGIRRAQELCARTYAPHACSGALASWVGRPRRAAPGGGTEGALAEELDRVRSELNATRQSPTFRLLNGLHRLLGGRGGS